MATGQGLEQYVQPEKMGDRGRPETWRRLCLTVDQESSGVCAAQFLERVCSLNIEKWWDFSHSNWRDIIASTKAIWPHALVALMSCNVPHGPWADDMRHSQCKTAMTELFRTTMPGQNPLFLFVQDQLIVEGQRQDILGLPDPDMELWRRCEAYAPWNNKVHKCVVNHFMGMRRRDKEETHVWTWRSLAYQFASLECGFYKGSRFERVVIKGGEEEAAPGARTSSKRLTATDRAARSSCQNALVAASLFYAAPENCVKQKIFWMAAEPLDRWHGEQAKQTRSSCETRDFLVGFVSGGFLDVVADVFRVGRSIDNLATIGFTLPVKRFSGDPSAEKLEGLRVVREDSWASELGRFCSALVGHKLRRMAYLLRGWPARSAGTLAEGAEVAKVLGELRKDVRAFSKLVDNKHLPGVKAVAERSVFNLVSTQQLVGICERGAWQLTPPVQSLLESSTRKTCPACCARTASTARKPR